MDTSASLPRQLPLGGTGTPSAEVSRGGPSHQVRVWRESLVDDIFERTATHHARRRSTPTDAARRRPTDIGQPAHSCPTPTGTAHSHRSIQPTATCPTAPPTGQIQMSAPPTPGTDAPTSPMAEQPTSIVPSDETKVGSLGIEDAGHANGGTSGGRSGGTNSSAIVDKGGSRLSPRHVGVDIGFRREWNEQPSSSTVTKTSTNLDSANQQILMAQVDEFMEDRKAAKIARSAVSSTAYHQPISITLTAQSNTNNNTSDETLQSCPFALRPLPLLAPPAPPPLHPRPL